MRRLIAALLLALSGCATQPLAPDPTIDPRGRWTVVAVGGEPTGGGERFIFEIEPPRGSAQFGCNGGSGSLRVDRGYLSTGDWIITTGACLPPKRMRFERKGFDITAQPMAIEARPGGGIRLRNRVGSIDLARTPTAALNPVGEWIAVAVDGIATGGGANFAISITPDQFRGRFGCNTIRGAYRIEGNKFLRGEYWGVSEMLCGDPTGRRDPLAFERRAGPILFGPPLQIVRTRESSIRLTNKVGSIDLARSR